MLLYLPLGTLRCGRPILKSMGTHTLCAVHGSEITQANIRKCFNQGREIHRCLGSGIPGKNNFDGGSQIVLRLCALPFDAQLTPSPHTPSGPLCVPPD